MADMSTFIQVSDKIYLAFHSTHEVSCIMDSALDVELITIQGMVSRTDLSTSPISFAQIVLFKNFLLDAKAEAFDKRLIVCAGHDDDGIATCMMLLGSVKILIDKSSVSEVEAIFQTALLRVDCIQDNSLGCKSNVSILDSWRGLAQAQSNGWIELLHDEVDIDRCIDIQEHLHYDNPLNGSLHVIIPSRLIAFKCPRDVEDKVKDLSNDQWVDVDGERHFSPSFYADILGSDFGVQVVVRCDGAKPERACLYDFLDESDEFSDDDEEADESWVQGYAGYDETAFDEAGLVVERICMDRDSRNSPAALLSSADRFLTLARLAPGAVAIHGGDGDGLGDDAELLVSSLLIKDHCFDARSALAWIHLAHPPQRPQEPLCFSMGPLDEEFRAGQAQCTSCLPARLLLRELPVLTGESCLSVGWRTAFRPSKESSLSFGGRAPTPSLCCSAVGDPSLLQCCCRGGPRW